MNTQTYFEDIEMLPKEDSVGMLAYCAGFIASLALTLVAYFQVVQQSITGTTLLLAVALLASVQFFIQVTCFLHLRTNKSSREMLAVFCFSLFITGILIIGSMWIMWSLNARMMPGDIEMRAYMERQTGI